MLSSDGETGRTQGGLLVAEEGVHKGDTALLQAGDLVPADIELTEARDLEVDEWALTGELLPVAKRAGDETTLVYRGSRVTRGSGRGIVVATGSATQFGQILQQSWERRERVRPSLFRARYAILLLLLWLLVAASVARGRSLGLAVLLGWIAGAAVLLLQNRELFDQALISCGIRFLKGRGIVIRDPGCLATVAQIDVVCLDKTGVLTTLDVEVGGICFPNESSVTTSSPPEGERSTLVGLGCALCNDVFFVERQDQASPIDAALMAYAHRLGYDREQLAGEFRRVYDKPFESEDRYMVAGFDWSGESLWFVKGDPDVVLRMCSRYLTASGDIAATDVSFLRSIRSMMAAAQEQGDIVLALAYNRETDTPPRRYVFLCLICLRNPMRPSVPAWVSALRSMKIRPLMLTGGRPEAALSIGRQAGIGQDATSLLTGLELARMPLQEVMRQAGYVSIFARLMPSQKAVLVRLLQRRGHCVAMVGDGANDAIALRVADVGWSFQSYGSPLARGASRIVVQDLDDILAAITCSRRIRDGSRALIVCRVIALLALFAGMYAWVLL